MIRVSGKNFLLNTKNTSYCFRVMGSGHLEQIFYGKKALPDDPKDEVIESAFKAMAEKREFQAGNSIAYSDKHQELNLENTSLELSTPGKGDVRENSLIMINSRGIRTSDPLFKEFRIIKGCVDKLDLPGSHAKDEAETLEVTLFDEYQEAEVILYYTVFYDCDVITRFLAVKNTGKDTLYLEKVMSLMVDLYGSGFRYTDFCGHWTREMHKDEGILKSGSHVICSRTGTSSNRANPLFLISDSGASEDSGSVYGFNLIYSGSHYESMSVGSFEKTRFMTGIEPESFSWALDAGESFYSPEGVMSYSDSGFTGLSLNFYDFIKRHILPERFAGKERPVLINSWEANYFDFTEESLVKLASRSAAAGIELFVLDDGWFGKRDDDHSSLGDWTVYKDKLPGGLKSLSDKIHELGMTFGLWVEPEMINEDSDLYREHPDYAVKVPGHEHSKGRDQLILDLTGKEVQDNVIAQMKEVFSSCRLEYVKWDMNRIFSDCYSSSIKAERQGEFLHRYVLGLYRIMRELTDAFPDILFEGCASGGNRFDLGILCYFPQIWGSDDTDAMERISIQEGYSYGYPMITVGSHVSAVPNHQTMRCEPFETRFALAMTGAFGYELALDRLTDDEFTEIKGQTEFYKKYRRTLQWGTYYRLSEDKWIVVSEDKKTAIGAFVKSHITPNAFFDEFKTKGLDPSCTYHVTNRVCDRDISDFGTILDAREDNEASGGGRKIGGEREDAVMPGLTLNSCGIRLSQGYGGTGYSENTRIMKDMDARIYIFEAV